MFGLKRSMVAVAAAVTLSSVAQAQVQFTGTTAGCFYPAGPACLAGAVDLYKGLKFTAGSFSGLTSTGGQIGFGAAFASNGTFGTVKLDNSTNDYANDFFRLVISFTAPTVTSATYTAVLEGSVTTNPLGGGVRLDFSQTPQTFTYMIGSEVNTFSVVVDDQSVGPNGEVALSGFITTAPEPGTVMLVGTGLLALIPVVRLRRKGQAV